MGTHTSGTQALRTGSISLQKVRQFLMTILAPVLILLGLTIWISAHPLIPLPASPANGMLFLTGIALGLVIAVRFFRWRLRLDVETTLALPDPLYAMYLATLILIGPRNAVLLAIIIALIAALPDLVQGTQAVYIALRQATVAAITMFFAGLVYFWIAQTFTPHITALRAHILGALMASVVTCIGAATIQFVQRHVAEHPAASWPNWQEIAHYLSSPSLRFQALLLSVAPLLPLAELLDDIEAEFAWLLFLIPLFAVYYLALMSIRLEQRSKELQRTVSELGVARRREAELTDYAALITRAQEDERRRLSRELHDDTAQALIALSRGLDALAIRRVEPPLSSLDMRFTEELGDLAKRTLESVRRACQDLRPSVLDDLGLSAALESLAHSETTRGLECTFHQSGKIVTCPPEMEVTIYRIAQESLANARQHGQASKTTLDLRYEPDTIALRITDNGIGFDPQRILAHIATHSADGTETRPGLGLLGMRERAALIHAHLTITSTVRSGTTVLLNVPLPANNLVGNNLV